MGHVTPEAAKGGLISLLEDGDKITIDASKETIDADLSLKEIEKERKIGKSKPVPKKVFWQNMPRQFNRLLKEQLQIKKLVLFEYALIIKVCQNPSN